MVETVSPEELKKEAQQEYNKKEYISAAKAFQAAAEGYTQLGDQFQAAEMHNNASVAYLQAKQPESALQSALNTDKTFAAAGDRRRQAIALGNQAAAYEALDQLESAVRAYQDSSNLLKEIGDRELRPAVMQSLSVVQLRQGQQLEALATMQASVEQVEDPGIKQKLLKKVLRSPFNFFNRLS
jgi:tetratricopeptide (TPR) repeat protein